MVTIVRAVRFLSQDRSTGHLKTCPHGTDDLKTGVKPHLKMGAVQLSQETSLNLKMREPSAQMISRQVSSHISRCAPCDVSRDVAKSQDA